MRLNKTYIRIDFYHVWKYIRLTRWQKEKIKWILFSNFSFLFNRFANYQQWKNAQVFRSKWKSLSVRSIQNDSRNKFLQDTNFHKDSESIDQLAIILHVFYLDIFEEIIRKISTLTHPDIKLFITCPENLHNSVYQLANKTSFLFFILDVENLGRDILPFIKILPLVIKENYKVILKIHTKRSNHLNKKNLWHTELFNKLLADENVNNIIHVLEQFPQVGMVGPSSHILPMSLYYGGNADMVKKLCNVMNLNNDQISDLCFVAGSMFYARVDALLPILELGLSESNFEQENGQIDNTMAHSVERIFAAGLISSGYVLIDSDSTPNNLSCRITINHPFTL